MTDERGKLLLENAYQLDTPSDNEKYYNELAKYYDKDFASVLGYSLPAIVAKKFLELAKDSDSPIADIGCGTGLIGVELASNDCIVDGFDISTEMLALSKEKAVYRNLNKVDLTASVDEFSNQYGAVLSSGTFTHGHLGPDAMLKLLGIAKSSALFVLTINKKHFSNKGFEAAIKRMIEDKSIVTYTQTEIAIYSESNHEHGADKGLLVCFRKSESSV